MRFYYKYTIVVLLIVFAASLKAQSAIERLQPGPKILKEIETISVSSGAIYCIADNEIERQAANYFKRLLSEKDFKLTDDEESVRLKVEFTVESKSDNYQNNQHYQIAVNGNTVIIKSPSVQGLIYGAVTFSNLIEKENSNFRVHLCSIDDYPSFQRRIFSALPTVDNIEELLDFALKNKIETIAIASRIFPWYEVSDEYLAILNRIRKWKNDFGAPNVMQMHNVYEDKKIVISDDADLDKLKNVIKVSCDYGITKTMICADDTPPFRYGEGYVLTNEKDLNRFDHLAEALTFLMNSLGEWSEALNINNELYFVPPFYTYEDMYYGEMELFKNTPWEDDAYKPLYRDLNYIGTNMSNNIFVVWTGPYVRSRTVNSEDLFDWTYNLKGTVPFLWDNTIYSHYPFSSSPMFTAYNNDFPNDFYVTTAGNGIFVNGNISQEDTKATAITTNDYLWNPENYNPPASLDRALFNLYGEDLKKAILSFKEIELGIREAIGERQLWFDADTLWSAIRRVKKLTTKNPFRYHLNYTRMKALRLQLKYSVPEPIGKNIFVQKILKLFKKREQVLRVIAGVNPKIAQELSEITIQEPEFNGIQ